jgi:hypothetical protein
MNRCFRLVPVLTLLAAPTLAQELPVTVQLRDGTRVPLQDWNLSYHYAAWNKDSSVALATMKSQDSKQLYVDKKAFDLSGATVQFEFSKVNRSRHIDGETKIVEVEQPGRFSLTEADGKRRKFDRPKVPHRDRVAPELDGDHRYQARGLYVTGSTLTGTRRTYCVFAYTPLVECSDNPELQVTQLDFP